MLYNKTTLQFVLNGLQQNQASVFTQCFTTKHTSICTLCFSIKPRFSFYSMLKTKLQILLNSLHLNQASVCIQCLYNKTTLQFVLYALQQNHASICTQCLYNKTTLQFLLNACTTKPRFSFYSMLYNKLRFGLYSTPFSKTTLQCVLNTLNPNQASVSTQCLTPKSRVNFYPML